MMTIVEIKLYLQIKLVPYLQIFFVSYAKNSEKELETHVFNGALCKSLL